jgi:hypothetical protein
LKTLETTRVVSNRSVFMVCLIEYTVTKKAPVSRGFS